MNEVIIPSKTYNILRGNKAKPFVAITKITPMVSTIKFNGFALIALTLKEGIIGNLNLLTINNDTHIVRTKISTSLRL